MTHSWNFNQKVMAGFAAVVTLAVLTGAISVYALRAVVATKDRVITGNARNVVSAARLETIIERLATAFRGFLISRDDRFLTQRAAAQRELGQAIRDLENQAGTEEGRGMVIAIERVLADYQQAQDRAIALRRSAAGLAEAARFFDDEVLPKLDAVARSVKAFVDREERGLEDGKRQSTERANLATTLVIGLATTTSALAILIAFLLARTLSRHIGAAVQHVQSSTSELQAVANQQAAGARESTTAMNEIATTISELLATSRQIAASAQQVAHIARETATAARTGDQTVDKTQEAIAGIRRQMDVVVGLMLELGKRSQQIGGVVDIINELAEQTNILAINATIEAAGAGEAGKRFSVVGDEIRKLADRVGGSTKEIRGLIDEIRATVNTTVMASEGGSKAVDAGMRHFADVAGAFRQITGLVTTTTEAAREIELSTTHQTTAVEQVNLAIGGAVQATRETEASSNQTLQTATQLAGLSRDLSRIVHAQAGA